MESKLEIIDLERQLGLLSKKTASKLHSTSENRDWNGNADKTRSRGKQEPGQERTQGTVEKLRNVTLMQHTYNFIESVGMQGVKYVFMRNTNVIRRKSKMTEQQLEMLKDMYKPFAHLYNLTGNEGKYDDVDMDEFQANTSYDVLQNLAFCEYRGKPCNHSHFYHKQRDVGVCTTFDPSNDPEQKYQVIGGRDGGIIMGVGVLEEEWTPGPFMNQNGMIVRVHDPKDEVVMVEDFGASIPIGHTVSLILSKKVVKLVPPPHGQCEIRDTNYYSRYTRDACETECALKGFTEHCGCRMPYMPNGTVKSCNNFQLMQCRNNFFQGKLVEELSFQCDCPPECQQTKYDVKIKQERISKGTSDQIREDFDGFDMLTSAVEIRVYFATLSYETDTEEAIYSFEKLLCDCGGAAGLFLGASFMSFIEVLDFMAYITWILSVKWWKRPKENEVQEISINI